MPSPSDDNRGKKNGLEAADEYVGRSHRPYSGVDPQVNPTADQSRPDYQPREGLWQPETTSEVAATARPVRRKRALPRSRVSITLRLMIALVVLAALASVFI